MATLEVVVVQGTKKFRDGWGWKHGGIDVAGLTHTLKAGKEYRIDIAGNKGAEVNSKLLHHEMGHFWDLSNAIFPGFHHQNSLSSCFYNWSMSAPSGAVAAGVHRHLNAGPAGPQIPEPIIGDCIMIDGVAVLRAGE